MKKSSSLTNSKRNTNQTMRALFSIYQNSKPYVCLVLMLHINEDGGKSNFQFYLMTLLEEYMIDTVFREALEII